MTAPVKENFLNTGGLRVLPEVQREGLAGQQPAFSDVLLDHLPAIIITIGITMAVIMVITLVIFLIRQEFRQPPTDGQ